MDETVEYWREKKAEFEEALELEHAMEEKNHIHIAVLKHELLLCEENIRNH